MSDIARNRTPSGVPANTAVAAPTVGPRVPRGTPTGGQFAASARSEAGISLGRTKPPKRFGQKQPPPILPREWAAAVGITHHSGQGEMAVFAASKPALVDLYVQAGLSEYEATRLASRMVTQKGANGTTEGLSTPWVTLVDAGVVDLSQPGIYLARRHATDAPVVRVDGPGEFTIVAHWRYGDDDLYVEPVEPERD